jgi:ribosomal protein L24E
VSIAEGHRTVEQCAFCGRETKSGIYVRQDPATVPYPTKDND